MVLFCSKKKDLEWYINNGWITNRRISRKWRNNAGKSFIINSLYCIEYEENRECSVTDFFTGMPIFLNNENFSILCPLSEEECECSEEEVVLEYKVKKIPSKKAEH